MPTQKPAKKTSPTRPQAATRKTPAKKAPSKKPPIKKTQSTSPDDNMTVLDIDGFAVVFGADSTPEEREAKLQMLRDFIAQLEDAHVISICERPGGGG